jgi:PAS domain S-box-containing protein
MTASNSARDGERETAPDEEGRAGTTPVQRAAEATMVLDSLQTHIAQLDAQGTIVSVNRAWREFGIANGATSEQAAAVGVNYLAVCAARPDDAGARAAYEGLASVLAGTAPSFEMEFLCNSATEERWFVMRVTPLLGPQGGAVVTHDNITQRRQLTQQRASLVNELFDFKTALDAHAIVTITDGDGRITYVNDKFCAISKWSRDELLGQDHRLVNSGHHSKEFIAELWATISSGRIWKGELKNRAKDGSIYWVDTTIVPLMGNDGRPYQYTAIRAEITQKKLLEEHNAEIVEELLAANRELSDFAYVVSHDLKAPLRGISSLASWLVTDFADQLGPEGRSQLDLIAAHRRDPGLLARRAQP